MTETNHHWNQDRNRVMYKSAVMVIDGVQWESAMPHNEKAVRRINQVVETLNGKLPPDGGVVLRLTRAQRLKAAAQTAYALHEHLNSLQS